MISFVGYTEGHGNNPTSGDFTLPTGWEDGDIGIFWWFTLNFGKTFTKPTAVSQKIDSAPVGFGRLFVGYRRLTTGDSTFGWTASDVSNSSTVWGVSVFRGVVQTGDPFEAQSGVAPAQTSNTEDPTNPPVDVVTDGACVLLVDGCINDIGFTAMPADYTLAGGQQESAGSDCAYWSAYRLGRPPGTETPGAWNFSGTLSTDDHQAWTGALEPIAENVAPSVDAGSDDEITLPDDATLDGTVSDDGLPASPGAVTTEWTKISGPGDVTFDDDTAVDTTASFSEEGEYVLQLEGDDGELQTTDTVTITVNAEPSAPAAAGANSRQRAYAALLMRQRGNRRRRR